MQKHLVRYPQLAIVLTFASMLAASWRRWTSPIADSGREMDLPLRLLEGEVLYRDVHFIYPPLSPYINAQLYRIFGAHLDVLLASGVMLAILISFICYRIARRLMSPFESSIATSGVVVWCVFKPAGNLIWPYAFAALHGMVFSLGSLLMVLRYFESRRERDLIFAGVMIGLSVITKQEFALAGAATATAALIYLHRMDLKLLLKDLALAALSALIVALPVYALMFHRVGWRMLIEDCHLFYTHLPPSLVFYNSHRTGLDRPLSSLLQMAGAAAVGIAAASAIALISIGSRKVLGRAMAVVFASLLVIFAVRLIVGIEWDGSPLRALPLVLVAIVIVEWIRGKGTDGSSRSNTALFIIAVYSLAVLARVALRVPSGGAFGGFFLPTSLIVVCYLLPHALPTRVREFAGNVAAESRARAIGLGLFIAMFVVTAVVFGVRYRRNFSHEIKASRGHLFTPRSSGPAIEEALKFIESKTNPGETIAVLPEGSDLAFLTGRRISLRHQILIPGLMSESDEQRAIERMRSGRVRYVFIVNRPMREFGAEAFGRDYYRNLGRWIDEHYRMVEVFGAMRSEPLEIGHPAFFIKVFARIE